MTSTPVYTAGRVLLEKIVARIDQKLAALHAARDQVAAVTAEFKTGACAEMENTVRRIKAPKRAKAGSTLTRRR